MGHLLSTILISISVNLDSFAIGIAYGVKKIKIGLPSNLAIATVTTLGTFLSMAIGERLGKFLPNHVANLLGSGALLAIGVWGIWETLAAEQREKNKKQAEPMSELDYSTFIEKPERADVDNSKVIDIKESITLAFALTINNLAGGVGAGLSGLNIFLTSAMTFILSISAIISGYYLGEKFTTKLSGKTSGILSASLIICIAIYEFFNN